MADLSKTIQIVFEGVDKVGPGLKSVGDGLDKFADHAKDATKPLADVAKGILAMDAAAVGLAVVLGTKAVQESDKFEDALAGVGKQLQASDPPLTEARKGIEALALKYGESGIVMAGSMAGFLAAGNDYGTSLSLVETATKLMIGGDLDAAKATETLTKSIAGFAIPANKTAEGAIKVADILNKLADISSGKPDELADGFSRLAPTAQAAGLTMEETGAVVAVWVDKFGSGEIAATAMKSGLLTLLTPAKDAGEELDRLGVKTKDASGEQRLASDILKDLSVATQKQTANQQLQSAAIIFGKEQAGTMNALLSDWQKTHSYVSQELDKTTGAVGSLDREMGVKMALMSTHIGSTEEAWRQFNNTLGDKIKGKDELNNLIDAWGRLALAAKESLESDSLDPLFTALQEHFTEIADYIDGVAKALPEALKGLDWSPVLTALGDVESGFGSMFGGLDLTKPENLHLALQGLVDTIGKFIVVTEGIVNGLKPLFTIIGTLATSFSELSPEVQNTVGYILGIGTTISIVSGPVGVLGTAISGLGKMLASAGVASVALIAAIAAFAVYDVTKIVQIAGAIGGIKEQGQLQATAAADIADKNKNLSDVFAELARATGVTVTSSREMWEAMRDGKLTTEQIDAAFSAVNATLPKTGTAVDAVGEQFQALEDKERKTLMSGTDITAQYNLLAGDTLPKAGDAVKKQTELTAANADGVSQLVFRHGQWVTATADVVKAMDLEAAAAKASADATAKKAKETEAMNKVTTEFMLGWEKIQSAERVSVFEIQSKVDIAQIEADAKRTVAAYTMMGDSFKNTGDVLGKLLDMWGSAKGNNDKDSIAKWIAKEYEIREAMAKTQQDLIAAEIRRMDAQTALAERGGMDVKISADGLEPDLQAFMFRVIDKVRVSVAGSYQDFLLGCGAT